MDCSNFQLLFDGLTVLLSEIVVVVFAFLPASASLCPGRAPLAQGLHPQEDNSLLPWPLRGSPPFHYTSLYRLLILLPLVISLVMSPIP